MGNVAPRPRGSPQRALLLCNPSARQGQEEVIAQEALREQGLDVLVPPARGADDLPRIIGQQRDRVDLIVVGGGDGTLQRAAPALRAAGRPVAILPMGTANDLARSLDIPLDLNEACRVAAAGRPRAVDLGVVNDRYFFNAAGIGLGAEVTRRLTGELKRRWGVLSYGRAVLEALRGRRAFRAEVRADGGWRRLRAVQITIGNGRYYGGGMTVAEDATIDDSLLHLYSVAPASTWRLLSLAPALRRGRHERREAVEVLRAARIEVRTERPMPVTADGELVARTPARFSVLPAALEVIAPPVSESQRRPEGDGDAAK